MATERLQVCTLLGKKSAKIGTLQVQLNVTGMVSSKVNKSISYMTGFVTSTVYSLYSLKVNNVPPVLNEKNTRP